LDRLGEGAACVAKGVSWRIGRIFHCDHEVFNFDLLPDDGHKIPVFVNLQQYYVEDSLATRAQALGVDLRRKNRVVAV
jgi:3-(3-hydroxy-phenyl)propionate hydroxylase